LIQDQRRDDWFDYGELGVSVEELAMGSVEMVMSLLTRAAGEDASEVRIHG
jgi:hypothetical protein